MITSLMFSIGQSDAILFLVGLGTPPLIAVALQGSSVVLSCSSEEWFPEPTMFWAMGNGEPLPVNHSLKKTSNGFFHVHSNIHLQDASGGHVYCGLQHPVTKTESGVYVSVSGWCPRAIARFSTLDLNLKI